MPDLPVHTALLKFPDNFAELDLEQQGRVIIHAMQQACAEAKLDLDIVLGSYEGSGDSFNGCEWVFYSETLGTGQAEYGKQVTNIEIEFGANAYDILAGFINEWVSHHYGGWENNDGGFGHVLFHLKGEPHIFMDYHERYTAERHMGDHELWETTPKEDKQ